MSKRSSGTNKTYKILLSLIIISLFCLSCGQQNQSINQESVEQVVEPINFDYAAITKRGTLRVVVDNSTTSYFIYKGKTMGYEYELLNRFATEKGLDLEILINNNLEEAFEMVNNGEADLIAYHLAITKERNEKVLFSEPHTTVRQVLVQSKPTNWRKMKLHEIENELIRSPLELAHQTIHVRKASSFSKRLQNIEDEIGDSIIVVEEPGSIDTEMLINRVSKGEIDFTVADEDVALINATYYPQLDVKTPLSFPQNIAWAMRKNAPDLKSEIDSWLLSIKQKPDFRVIYNRYFKNNRSQRIRAQSEYSSISKKAISPYDDIIRDAAEETHLDWRLLTALIYQESRFDPKSESWMGAKGLMQVTDRVADDYDVDNIFNPDQNVLAGTRHLQWLNAYWEDKITDEDERLKFVIGSYNVGHGHILDARKLTEKYGGDPNKWDGNVADYLLLKSQEKYFTDPVVVYGYCRGREPVNYVDNIFDRFDQYKLFFDKQETEVATSS